jgi:16S rRNA (cytosine967-C5)-methyltransferase
VLLEENEQQIAAFLVAQPGFRVIDLAEAWTLEAAMPGQGDYLTLTPLAHHTDGFFTAVMERTA